MTPRTAIQELQEAPWPLLHEVMGLRAYARRKQAFDSAKDPYELPASVWQPVEAVRKAITRQRLMEQGQR